MTPPLPDIEALRPWAIMHGPDDAPVHLTGRRAWSRDPEKALLFARRIDAAVFLDQAGIDPEGLRIDQVQLPALLDATAATDALRRERDALRVALVEIAHLDDTRASDWLEKTGSYNLFDEPASVQTARAALAATEPQP